MSQAYDDEVERLLVKRRKKAGKADAASRIEDISNISGDNVTTASGTDPYSFLSEPSRSEAAVSVQFLTYYVPAPPNHTFLNQVHGTILVSQNN